MAVVDLPGNPYCAAGSAREVFLSMSAPPFVGALSLSIFQPLPRAERRILSKLFSERGLVSEDFEFDNDADFYGALGRFYAEGPANYAIIRQLLQGKSQKSARRTLLFSSLDAISKHMSRRELRDILDSGDFCRRLAEFCVMHQLFDEVAFFLWAAWMGRLEKPDQVAMIIDLHPRIRERFGNWRPADDVADKDVPCESQTAELGTERDDLEVFAAPAVDAVAAAYGALRSAVDAAETENDAAALDLIQRRLDALREAVASRAADAASEDKQLRARTDIGMFLALKRRSSFFLADVATVCLGQPSTAHPRS
jgi:hypothetical protein